MSIFTFYVWLLFPIPAVLLVLLMVPLPKGIKKSIVSLTDAVLFVNVHPSFPFLTLFWFCVGISFLTLSSCVNAFFKGRTLYESVKMSGGDSRDSLIKLLAAERNLWISMSATCLWIILHRYRHLEKKYYMLEMQQDSSSNKKAQ